MREHPGAEQSASSTAPSEVETEPAKACTIQIDVHEGGSGSAAAVSSNGPTPKPRRSSSPTKKSSPLTRRRRPASPTSTNTTSKSPKGSASPTSPPMPRKPADVLGVSGASEDGSYVYFAADGALSGNQENSHDANAEAGKANLYLRHAGTTTFIATLIARRGQPLRLGPCASHPASPRTAAYIAFDSIDSLTGYDNHPIHPEACEPVTFVAGSPCPGDLPLRRRRRRKR